MNHLSVKSNIPDLWLFLSVTRQASRERDTRDDPTWTVKAPVLILESAVHRGEGTSANVRFTTWFPSLTQDGSNLFSSILFLSQVQIEKLLPKMYLF